MKEKYLVQYRLGCHENISVQFIYLKDLIVSYV